MDVESTLRVSPRPPTRPAAYLLYRRHLFAYEEACRRSGAVATAVDLGAGLGYAVSLLRRTAARVVAVDLARSPLRELVAEGGVLALQADAARLPLASRTVDLVVAFQLIEHLPPAGATCILTEIKRVLRPGGLGCVTTPNARWRLLRGQRPWNPYHVKEYRPADIRRLCRSAGLDEGCLSGVVGVDGAQEVEVARVRQDPLVVWGGSLGRYLRKVIGGRGGGTAVDEGPDGRYADPDRAWFVRSPDYAAGLDFWVEIRGD